MRDKLDENESMEI